MTNDEVTEENYLEVLREQSTSLAMKAAGPDDDREAVPVDESDDDVSDDDIANWDITA